jgi:histidyl-tRNA synthetase
LITFIISKLFSSANFNKTANYNQGMKLQLAKGVRDIPPEEKILKNKVLGVIKRTFELYGFAPLETPIIERYETLSAKSGAGEESDALKETFKLTDQGRRKLGLRFELTTSLARYVAGNPALKLPFKRYEFGRVFRDGPLKLGRYREFWQCDADTIGTKSMLADAECVAMLSSVFKNLGLASIIKINNRKILNGILNQAGIKKQKEALIAIDKLDKIGVKGVSEELKERGYSDKQSKEIFKLISPGIKLNELKDKISDKEGLQGLAEISELVKFLRKMNVKFEFDVTLARGQAYYSGTVMEAFLKKSEITSSIAGGGRFDKMVGEFMGGGREIPAVGISFGIAPIMDALKLAGELGAKTEAKVLVIPINTIDRSLDVVQTLRGNGIAADFALGKKGVSKNLQYANALGIPYVAIIGETEVKKGKVLLRDMSSGTEQLLNVEGVIKKLRSS